MTTEPLKQPETTPERVMALVAMYVEHATAVDRLEALGRATPETIKTQRRTSHSMRITLNRLADLLDGSTAATTVLTPEQRELLGDTVPAPDPDGAKFIRACLTAEGVEAMKALHEATRSPGFPVFGDPDQ